MMVPNYNEFMEVVEGITNAARLLYGVSFVVYTEVMPDAPLDPAKMMQVRSALCELIGSDSIRPKSVLNSCGSGSNDPVEQVFLHMETITPWEFERC